MAVNILTTFIITIYNKGFVTRCVLLMILRGPLQDKISTLYE